MDKTALWKDEIEKKYKLKTSAAYKRIELAAQKSHFRLLHAVQQRDWMPDFQDWRLKQAHILLRIRYLTYETDSATPWVITLKQKAVVGNVHRNKELEVTADTQELIPALEQTLYEMVKTRIDLLRIVADDRAYMESIGLTSHRMLLEKRRREYSSPDGEVLLALDELPNPLGYFAELESHDEAAAFENWEAKLGLDKTEVIAEDYGHLVKALQGGNCRTLMF